MVIVYTSLPVSTNHNLSYSNKKNATLDDKWIFWFFLGEEGSFVLQVLDIDFLSIF